MDIGGFTKSDFAEFPNTYRRRSPLGFNAKVCITEGHNDIVFPMRVPERCLAGRNRDVPDAHELIFEFRMMMRLAGEFNRRLLRIGLRNPGSWIHGYHQEN